MTPKQFDSFLTRDKGECYATGRTGDTLVPQHRVGGMGGNRPETPASVITFDAITNGLIESDPYWQRQAYLNGWKLRNGVDPTEAPVWHRRRGWLMLDDDFNVRRATRAEVAEWQEYTAMVVHS